MSRKNLPVIGLTVVLVACLVAAWLTRDAATTRAPSKPAATVGQPLSIDQSLLQTAHRLTPLAETREEQNLSGEAERLADHELDQSFESALREGAAAKPATSGPIQQLTVRIAQVKARITADQSRIARLTKDAAAKDGRADSAAGQLDVAKAQLALDQDELADAQQDLVRQGGDEHARLQRAQQEHEAAQQAADSMTVKPVPTPESGPFLAGQVKAWMALDNKNGQLQAAAQQAASKTAKLEREHQSLESLVNKTTPPPLAAPPADDSSADDADAGAEVEDPAAMTARLKGLSDQRKTLTELDRRIQDGQQLAEAYKAWSALVDTKRHAVVHQMLQSFSVIVGILLAVVLAGRGLRHAFRNHEDRRRTHQLRFLSNVGVQAAGLIAIVLVILGPPSQTPTILGLAGAGMTVVLKDFIVAFFGWFVLMGKNGLHVGDWVEINGVGGEVVEIGLLKTVLLEMGNWTNTGHPTGRRVSFMNGYAIEGHYFNFSTANQWLWDELQVTLPPGGDPYGIAEQIRQTVETATEAEAVEAAQDWQRVTHQYGTREFSAKPAVDLRPSVNGLDVFVRYITRAPQRYIVKSHLFQQIVPLLRGNVA